MAMAVERVLFQVNTRTAMSVGQASGLALALAGRAGVPVVHYSPNEVKLAVAGDGGAGKYEVQQMVARLLQLRRVPDPPDAADALALALCHWWRAPLAAAGAGRAGHGGSPSHGASPRLAEAIAAAVAREDGDGDRVGAGHRDRAHAPPARCWSRSGESGYRAFVPAGALPRSHPGDAAFLFTHLHVREDAMVLYGFPTRDERDTFEALIGTTGVGPKLALAMLSVHSPAALRRAAARRRPRRAHAGARGRQAHRATAAGRAQGPPRGTRARPHRAGGDAPAPRAEVRAALAGLGYAPDEVRDVVAQLPEEGSVEELLRDALKLLAVTACVESERSLRSGA